MVKSSILEELLVMKTFLNDKRVDRDHLFSQVFLNKSQFGKSGEFILLSSFGLKEKLFALNRICKYFEKVLWNF